MKGEEEIEIVNDGPSGGGGQIDLSSDKDTKSKTTNPAISPNAVRVWQYVAGTEIENSFGSLPKRKKKKGI